MGPVGQKSCVDYINYPCCDYVDTSHTMAGVKANSNKVYDCRFSSPDIDIAYLVKDVENVTITNCNLNNTAKIFAYIADSKNVTIKNVVLNSIDHPIIILGGSDILLENVSFMDTNHSITVMDSTDLTIDGIKIDGGDEYTGISIEDTKNFEVSNSKISIKSPQIEIINSNGKIKNNILSYGIPTIIDIANSHEDVIYNNTVSYCNSYNVKNYSALNVQDSNNTTVLQNRFYYNEIAANFSDTNNPRFLQNDFSENIYGIVLDTSYVNTLFGNVFKNNKFGVSSKLSGYLDIHQNNIVQNDVGIYLFVSSGGPILQGNNITQNNVGIRIFDYPNYVIKQNRTEIVNNTFNNNGNASEFKNIEILFKDNIDCQNGFYIINNNSIIEQQNNSGCLYNTNQTQAQQVLDNNSHEFIETQRVNITVNVTNKTQIVTINETKERSLLQQLLCFLLPQQFC